MEAGKHEPGRAFCPKCGQKYAVPEEELLRRPGIRFRATCRTCETPFSVEWRDGALKTEIEEILEEGAEDRDVLHRGTRIGKYEIEGLIDSGGTSSVYKAFETGANRYVALKVLHRPADSDYGVRFRREVEVQGNLKHPNLMPIFDQGVVNGKPFYTMELLHKPTTLETVIGLFRAGRLGFNPHLRTLDSLESLLRHILMPVARAIQFANEQHGILHRDLKPDNVILDARTLRVYVIDFGICHVFQQAGSRLILPARGGPTPETEAEERRRLAMGTARFMPPEQARGEIAPQGDVWALGALLYYMLSGEFPIARALDLQRVNLHKRITNLERIVASCHESGDSEEAAFYEARLAELKTGEVRTMRDVLRDAQDANYVPLQHGVPPALAAIVQRAMRKEPAERYASAAEFAADVQAWLEGRPVRAYAAALGAPRAGLYRSRLFTERHRTPLLAAGAVLLVGLGALATWFLHSTSREEARVEDWMRQAVASGDPDLQKELMGKVLTLRPDHTAAQELLESAKAFAPLRTRVLDAMRVKEQLDRAAAELSSAGRTEAPRVEARMKAAEQTARDMAAVLERGVLPDLRALPASYPWRATERQAEDLVSYLRGRRLLEVHDTPPGVEVTLIPPRNAEALELDWEHPRLLGSVRGAAFLDPGSYVLRFTHRETGLTVHLPFQITRPTPERFILRCPFDPSKLPPEMVFVEGAARAVYGDPRFFTETMTVEIAPFLLDATEVTNARYQAYVSSLPAEERPRAVPRRRITGAGDRTVPLWTEEEGGAWRFPGGTGDHPVTGISLQNARDFAAFEGKRLPTPQEWEFAARGADGRDYPFGSLLDVAACNAHTGSVARARAFPQDRAPCGAWDMGGNVAEWTEDGSGAETAVVKGGSFELPRFHALASAFERRTADSPWPDVGFRCARSLP